MLRVLSLLIFLSLAFSACSAIKNATDDDFPEGRCEFHTDCPEGMKCVNTYCEDLYYPRRDIKTY